MDTNNINVKFDCQYVDGEPVVDFDSYGAHVHVNSIDVSAAMEADKAAKNWRGARLMLVVSHARDEVQLVAVHPTRRNGYANRKNRVIARALPGSAFDRLVRTHTARPESRWGVTNYDPKTGTVEVWLETTDENTGIPYETIRAAEEVLEEAGINKN